VTPTLDHLSPDPELQSTLLLMIHRLSGRLVLLDEVSSS
jgi:hypothetical protein